MQDLTLIGIALGLAMDAFAVSIASSIIIGRITRRHLFRLSFHFGLFQAMMPIIGWLVGSTVQQYIKVWDHWVAFILLSVIGVKAIHGAFKKDDKNKTNAKNNDPSRGLTLVILSIATSIDALAVGLSFAMLDVSIWYPSAVIGVITAIVSMTGVFLGNRLGMRFGKLMEIIGGMALIGIGLKILFEHLFF